MKVYIDGAYYEREDAKISVFDHGLLYGDGVFEGIRIYHGRVFRLAEHLERLYRSAAAIALEIPLTPAEMESAVRAAVAANARGEGYIRLVVTRGEGNLGLNPLQCPRASVIIIVDDIQLYPEENYHRGIAIIIASLRRVPADSLDPRIKSLNYLNNILAKTEALRAGCLEAVLLNHDGMVAECTGDNIFIVRNGELLTPSPAHGALEGITRNAVLELARGRAVPAREAALTPYDLYTADECFLTGTGAEIMPVVKIDGRAVGTGTPGVFTGRMLSAFHELIARG
ncbi:MAG: branched-chain-amino-acid transaminase [Spirochaetes bacterium]|nr:MAG: branched-chain-amino-acid transaminase [Spirochaetota bacterium]